MKKRSGTRPTRPTHGRPADNRIDRRTFLTGAAALVTVSVLPACARIEQGSEEQAVFLDYTQEELDRAYDQSEWASNQEEMIERYTTESEAVRAELEHKSGVSYGSSPDETLDIFPTARQNAPIHVFVHGGAWRALTKDDSSFPAPVFVDAGAHYVALNFSVIPDARLPEMADQVRRAIAWLYGNARSFDGDPDQIYVSGHSSGGHLAGVLLTTDWGEYDVPDTVIKGALCASGIFDLRPVLLSSRGSYVELSEEEEEALSPIRHIERIRSPVIVAYGDEESPEFKRQSRDFASALEEAGHPYELVELASMNHFEVITTMAQENGELAQAALGQMGLTA